MQPLLFEKFTIKASKKNCDVKKTKDRICRLIRSIHLTYKESFSKDDYFGFTDTRILGYAEAVYDYAATATSQLSLCRGDKVAILSKTGSDKGWWKGEHCISGKVCQNYIHAF